MDLKFKKLVLLTMEMNNANQSVIRASPKKIINLQLYNNVFINDYITLLETRKLSTRDDQCLIVYYIVL